MPLLRLDRASTHYLFALRRVRGRERLGRPDGLPPLRLLRRPVAPDVRPVREVPVDQGMGTMSNAVIGVLTVLAIVVVIAGVIAYLMNKPGEKDEFEELRVSMRNLQAAVGEKVLPPLERLTEEISRAMRREGGS